MQTDRPVASVSGTRGWEWNRWQADVRSRGRSTGVSTSHPPAKRERTQRERIGELQRQIDELEAELERKECRLQSVIDHYERLLTERESEVTADHAPESAGGSGQSLVSKLFRY